MSRKHLDRVQILDLHPVVPGGPPLVQIYTELCIRASTCRVCPEPLLKGERRLVIESWNHTRSRRERAFFHTGCMSEAMQADKPKKPRNYCRDCQVEFDRDPFGFDGIDDDFTTNKVYVHGKSPRTAHMADFNRTEYGTGTPSYICNDCAASPRWHQCYFCRIYQKKSKITWTVDGIPKLICLNCAAMNQTRTRRDVLREAAEDRKFRRIQKAYTENAEED